MRKGFVKLDRELLDYDISDTAKIIYALMMDRRLYYERIGIEKLTYTNKELRDDMHRHKDTITKAIKELEKVGLIASHKTQGKETTYILRPLVGRII